jgi:hypothetical protein
MKPANALWIWLCRILGPICIFCAIRCIYDPVFCFGNNPSPDNPPAAVVAIFPLLPGVCMCFYGYKKRTKQQMKDSYKAAANSIKDGVTIAAVATAAVIDEEMKKKERNKPLTKGDLEDLKAELRRKERGY